MLCYAVRENAERPPGYIAPNLSPVGLRLQPRDSPRACSP
jgi:hypothetical protein